MAYLNITAAARQWSANLHSHVFCAENAFALRGPQRQVHVAGSQEMVLHKCRDTDAWPPGCREMAWGPLNTARQSLPEVDLRDEP